MEIFNSKKFSEIELISTYKMRLYSVLSKATIDYKCSNWLKFKMGNCQEIQFVNINEPFFYSN